MNARMEDSSSFRRRNTLFLVVRCQINDTIFVDSQRQDVIGSWLTLWPLPLPQLSELSLFFFNLSLRIGQTNNFDLSSGDARTSIRLSSSELSMCSTTFPSFVPSCSCLTAEITSEERTTDAWVEGSRLFRLSPVLLELHRSSLFAGLV